jgi:hypothetical protein
MKRAKRRSLEQEYKRHVRRRQKEWERRWELPISSDEYLSSEQSLTAEDKYNCGDNTTILSSLATYLSLQLATRLKKPISDWARQLSKDPIPDWLCIAFLRAYKRAVFCEIDSWDQVFGPPVETETGHPARGKARLAMQRKLHLKFEIYDRVEQLVAEGNPVERALFERVATHFGIGRAQAERLYYDNRFLIEITQRSLQKSADP